MEILTDASGTEWAVRREDLSRKTGESDRAVRKHIECLRKKGHPIISSSHGAGYRIAQTDDELYRFIREYAHHAYAVLETVTTMEHKWLEKDQTELEA